MTDVSAGTRNHQTAIDSVATMMAGPTTDFRASLITAGPYPDELPAALEPALEPSAFAIRVASSINQSTRSTASLRSCSGPRGNGAHLGDAGAHDFGSKITALSCPMPLG